MGLAASCALIEDVCAYYQPDSAMPVTVQSSAASPKTDQKSDAAGTNDQESSENEASQQSRELQDVADVNLELNIKKRLAFRFSISLPADYLKPLLITATIMTPKELKPIASSCLMELSPTTSAKLMPSWYH